MCDPKNELEAWLELSPSNYPDHGEWLKVMNKKWEEIYREWLGTILQVSVIGIGLLLFCCVSAPYTLWWVSIIVGSVIAAAIAGTCATRYFWWKTGRQCVALTAAEEESRKIGEDQAQPLDADPPTS